ncbi:MAG: acyl-CoA dehydrogenase, partial [Gammaproteobacteria bacterium]|nr:acyl-CoA dehydrogenase [Gammaproteobacteria bacterium]
MLWWFLTITIILIIAYQRCPPRLWASVIAIWIIISAISGSLSTPTALLSLLFLGLVAAPFFLHELRRSLITDKILVWFQKSLPAISTTERVALEAGTVWWEAELFTGQPDWHHMLG